MKATTKQTSIKEARTILLNSIDINQNDFLRIDSDYYGNPRYVLHFLNINNDYNRALYLTKSIGGKKYHNKSYGGGIVFQSHNLQDECFMIKNRLFNELFNDIIINGFDLEVLHEYNNKLTENSRAKTLYTAWFKKFYGEFEYNIKGKVNSKRGDFYNYAIQYTTVIKDYLQGLPSSLNFEFETYKILEVLNIAMIDTSDNNIDYDNAYWVTLANTIFNNLVNYNLI